MAEALKSILANSQEAMAKRDEKKRQEKEATAAMYINLTKEAIEVRRMDIEAKRLDIEAMRLDAEAKTRAEDNKIMLADFTNMDEDQRAWILNKRTEICAREHNGLLYPRHSGHIVRFLQLYSPTMVCQLCVGRYYHLFVRLMRLF